VPLNGGRRVGELVWEAGGVAIAIGVPLSGRRRVGELVWEAGGVNPIDFGRGGLGGGGVRPVVRAIRISLQTVDFW